MYFKKLYVELFNTIYIYTHTYINVDHSQMSGQSRAAFVPRPRNLLVGAMGNKSASGLAACPSCRETICSCRVNSALAYIVDF